MEPAYVKLKEIKPAVSGYIRDSQLLLKGSEIPGPKAVHDVRVLLKKSRALLKLASPQLDKALFEKDISDLRETGRMMSSWREASVQRKILKDFRKEYPDIIAHLHEYDKLNYLLARDDSSPEHDAGKKASLEQMQVLLNKTGYRIRFQSMKHIDPHLLLKRLESTYESVSAIYLACRNNPKTRALHYFRKKSKDFLYQLSIFRALNPSVIKTIEKKLDSLTQNLGKFNDHAQLIRALEYDYKDAGNPPALDELVIKIRERQERYLGKVWPSAFQVFCPGQKLVNLLGFKLLTI